jgi:hypothetical protein
MYTRRLLSLPPTSPLLTTPGHNPLSYWRPSFFPPTTLQRMVESRNPNAPHFTHAPPPYYSSWTHPRFLNRTEREHHTDTRALISHTLHTPTHFLLYVHKLPVPSPAHAHSFLLYRNCTLIMWDVSTSADDESAWWGALIKGLQAGTSPPHGPPPSKLTILYHSRLLHTRLLSLAIKSHCLPYILNFRSILSSFLNADFSRVVETRLFKKEWVQVPGRTLNTRILQDIQPTLLVEPPTTHKLLPFTLWQRDLQEHPPRAHHVAIAYTLAPTPTPPPFVQGILSHRTRRAFSNGLQLLTRHVLRLYLGRVLTKGQGELLPRLESGLPGGNDAQTPVML